MLITEERKITTRDVFIDGHRIKVAIREGNKNKIPLVLFNGLGANWELVFSAFKSFDADIEIIAFDVPGTGSSSVPILPYSVGSLARTTHKMLINLNYQKVHVLGISWGGGLAQKFACKYPEHCKKLILAATSPGVLMVPANPWTLFKMMTPLRYWSPGYMRRIAGSIYGGEFRTNTELVNKLIKKIKPNSLWGYFLQLSALSRFTSLPWLKKIKQPTLVVAGDDDPIIPLVNAKILVSKIPNATLLVVKGGGHLFLMAQPENVMPKLEKFLKEDQVTMRKHTKNNGQKNQ